MRYYVTRIQTKTDGTEVRNLTGYDTWNEAEIQYHKVIVADMSATDIASALAYITNSEGGAYTSYVKKYVAETTTTE